MFFICSSFKALFQEKSLCFTSCSGTFSTEMNQKDPEKCELTFFFFFRETDKNLISNVFVQSSMLRIS